MIDTFIELEYDIKYKLIAEQNRRCGDKNSSQCARYVIHRQGTLRGHLQRDRGLRKVREQAVKWTTEGAGNETKSSVFCDVRHTSAARDIIVS